MKNKTKMDRQQILLRRLRLQREQPDVDLWETCLALTETPLKESIASPGLFNQTAHEGGVFDRSPSLTSDESTSVLFRLLDTLPDIQRRILRLTYWDGMTEDEIASILKISRSTVRYQKHAAISILRQKSQPNFLISEGAVSFSSASEPRQQINKQTNESEKK